MKPVSLGGDRTHTAVLFSLIAESASAPIAAKSHSPADTNQVSGAGAAWGLASPRSRAHNAGAVCTDHLAPAAHWEREERRGVGEREGGMDFKKKQQGRKMDV